MRIPDEAVEAAAKGMSPYMWDNFRLQFISRGMRADRASEAAKDEVRKIARIALEAAAPRMVAQGWNEATSEAEYRGWMTDMDAADSRRRNPYREGRL